MTNFPYTVMVTRSKPGGDILCKDIVAAGGEAIYFPTIDIVPPLNLLLFEKQLAKLNQIDWLIFISQQAVYASHEKIRAAWPTRPARTKIAAVGAGTAKALRAANFAVDVFPEETWSSEGLLHLPEFQDVQGKKIAIVRGEGGREWLAESLKLRGATVAYFTVYRRVLPDADVSAYIALLQANKIDIIVASSGDGLRNLKVLFQQSWELLRKVPLLVISPRMVDLAGELGFAKVLLAKNAGHNAIMETLLKQFLPWKKSHLL